MGFFLSAKHEQIEPHTPMAPKKATTEDKSLIDTGKRKRVPSLVAREAAKNLADVEAAKKAAAKKKAKKNRVPIKRAGTMDITAIEGQKFLEGKKKKKVKRAGTMDVTAKEGEEFLAKKKK